MRRMIGGLDLSKTPAIMTAGTTKKAKKMEKLAKIQKELKAPKGQMNKFGGYRYRSCEDILEAVKPLLDGAILTLQDDIIYIGDRFYVKATAKFTDGDYTQTTTAYAREPLDKKGADASQITGMASSYARKYALNGLFCIDDTKDADTMDNTTAQADEQIAEMKRRIKAMLEALDPAIDTAEFNGWESCNDKAKLLEIGKALKKLAG